MGITDLFKKIGIEEGLRDTPILDLLIVFGIGLILSWAGLYIARRYVYRIIVKATRKTKVKWDDILLDASFFRRLSYLIPVMIFKILSIVPEWEYMWVIDKAINIALSIVVALIVISFLQALNSVYETYNVAKQRPLKSIIQAINVIITTLTIIVIVGIVIDKSLSSILLGLGAFAAVVMLIFKDTIISFIAGIQIITNQMVKIGDWIVTQDNSADGNVIDISLYTITVLNWDRTITLLPAYKLVSEPFVNWRSMEEGGGRRIKRSINIDMDSVRFLSDEDITKFKESTILNPYIEHILNELEPSQNMHIIDTVHLTNLGLFRNYLNIWISSNQNINTSMTHMVRQLEPTPAGIPLQIYCFSSNKNWVPYEGVQADIFDHVISIMPLFGLKVYQYPASIVNN